MYTLYTFPDACSLATHAVLLELGQSVRLVNKNNQDDFSSINPVAAVPVLVDGKQTLCEGAAILLYLLDKHNNSMLPTQPEARQQAIENILFANATMHPAYGLLFFAHKHLTDEKAKQQAFTAAMNTIARLWQVVSERLGNKTFLGGDEPSAADFLLTVYSRWGQFFNLDIAMADNVQHMIANVMNRPSFQLALSEQTRLA